MFYIFNKENQCVSSCDFAPNTDDLAARNEKAVESTKIYKNIAALQLENKKIVEIEVRQTFTENKKSEKKISLTEEIAMLKERIEQLEKQGV
jgi:hypothetical protein